MNTDIKKIAVIGASRGLGLEFFKQSFNDADHFLLSARSIESLSLNSFFSDNVTLQNLDCTKSDSKEHYFNQLNLFKPTHIYFIAGGGPYGAFQDKEFKDHQWAYELNLLFPAELIHKALKIRSCLQLICVGSSVAEDKADKGAASYASAKHGLKGLIRSINEERNCLDLRLFSPSYINTTMLPDNAPVYNEYIVDSVESVASQLLSWSKEKGAARHYTIKTRTVNSIHDL